MTGDLLRQPARARPASERCAGAIAGALAAAGTRLLFGVPGGGPNLDVVGAAAQSGLTFVLAHGETAATIMAATCADLTGAPGAVLVTRGPGLASAVNGIAHAALDRLPLVVIADSVPAQDRDRISHQRLDQAALGRSVAKAAIALGPDGADQVAARAVALAAAPPPGPVVLNVDASDRQPAAGPPAAGPPAAGPPAAAAHGRCDDLAPLPAALAALASHRARHSWPGDAGRAAKTTAGDRLRRVAAAGPGCLAPQDVVTAVREHAPPETIATVDAGAHMLVAMPLWPVDEPHRLLISSGLATMGYALPAAIGAALCAPDRPVIAFTGDGGLGMTLMELETAVRHRLRIVVVVFNDATLSLIRIKQRAAGQGGAEAVGYGPTSFAAIAAAVGAAAAAVTDIPGLTRALAGALDRGGPTLIDARVDPAAYPAVMELTRGAAGRQNEGSAHGST